MFFIEEKGFYNIKLRSSQRSYTYDRWIGGMTQTFIYIHSDMETGDYSDDSDEEIDTKKEHIE